MVDRTADGSRCAGLRDTSLDVDVDVGVERRRALITAIAPRFDSMTGFSGEMAVGTQTWFVAATEGARDALLQEFGADKVSGAAPCGWVTVAVSDAFWNGPAASRVAATTASGKRAERF